MNNRIAICTLMFVGLSVALFCGADWPQLRGPGGSGVSRDLGLPVTWSSTEGIVWKTALPGFGASTPITLGDKIFLTAYSGYGLDKDSPGSMEDLKHHVICVDRTEGKILWDKSTKARLPEQAYSGMMPLHGYASSTPITDGRVVYAFFGRSGVCAYTTDGEFLWRADVGGSTHKWGSATSPILWNNLLIVNASVESESVVALDKKTGKEKWRAEGIRQSWSTPVLVDLPGGKQELVVSMHSKVRGYDPANGKQLWECQSVRDYVCPIVIAEEDVVFVTGGRTPLTIAVKAGGRGDVTDSHLLWELKKTPEVPSPLYYNGLLYWVSARGIACCVDAKTGKVVYEEHLSDTGIVYASAVLGDGKLYIPTREDGTIVLDAGGTFKELARNKLGDDSVFNATPVISQGQLLLRSDRFLYCIGK